MSPGPLATQEAEALPVTSRIPVACLDTAVVEKLAVVFEDPMAEHAVSGQPGQRAAPETLLAKRHASDWPSCLDCS